MKTTENLSDLGNITFVNLAKDLLSSSIESSQIMAQQPYTPETSKYAKLTLGYLNAFLNSYKTRMSYWKMTGVKEKIAAIQKTSKN